MSDLFHESVPFEFIAGVFAIMGHTRRHTYQVLTKRPQRMLEFFKWVHAEFEPHDFGADDRIMDHWPAHIPWESQNETGGRGYDTCGPAYPYENVWIGVSVEDQATADERIPLLLQTPAAVRWISAEPLLGPIRIDEVLCPKYNACQMSGASHARIVDLVKTSARAIGWIGIDWVVAGGESGPHARPSHTDWYRSLRDQCTAAGVPFFFKQWGEWAPHQFAPQPGINTGAGLFIRADGQLGVQGDWGDGTAQAMDRVGKRIAGRILDGRTWDQYP